MLKTTFNRCYLRAFASSALAITLAACGGGGAGDNAQLSASGSQTSVLDNSTGGVSTGTTSSVSATDTASSSAITSSSTNDSGSSASGAGGTTSPTAAPAQASAPAPAPAPATVSTSTVSGPYGQDAAAYTLAFSEEFDSFDTSKWNDHMWYDSSNSTKNYTVENGALKIWPQRDASGNFFNRTIDTDGKYYQTYGYFEVEAKLPVGKGTWPAFWLFNHIGDRRPEIDVMEAYAGGATPWGTVMSDGQPHPTMFASTIWRTIGQQVGTYKLATADLSAGFHKYGVKWEPNKLTFYFDGNAFYSVNTSFSDPMYLMLDLWYGSASGSPDNSTPQGKSNSYVVNYVRAWKFK
jgi:beta-glucanase (GH16 family)